MGLVAACCHEAVEALGPLIAPGSHFFEFLIDVGTFNFPVLCLSEAIRWVLSGPGLAVGEVMLAKQSRLDLIWLVDVMLGIGNSVILSGRWRAFAVDHHLLISDRLVFRFKLGMLEVVVRIFNANDVRRTYPLPAQME
jgi:hypothetical protein